MEVKGTIPWSSQLSAEVSLGGHFRIHVPGRTYYLEDASGDQAMAESWVQTICNVQALAQPPSARQAAAPTSPATPRIASLDSLDVE